MKLISGKSKRGFTLVEISVALLVVAFGFIAVLAVFPVGLKMCQTTNANQTTGLAAKSLYGSIYIDTPLTGDYEGTMKYCGFYVRYGRVDSMNAMYMDFYGDGGAMNTAVGTPGGANRLGTYWASSPD
jgi:prepilin-type N-terminal cleavage/methylation domain-containing protein